MLDADATVSVLAERPDETALLFDFDGTLSHIVEHADDAVAHPDVVALLGALVPVFGRVALVSGRPVEFLAREAPIAGIYLAGLYGLESLEPGGQRRVDPRAVPFLPNIEAAAAEFDARLAGVHVERKAGLCVTLHWRQESTRQEEIRAIAGEVATREGLVVLEGRMSVELRPPVPVDKGTATDALVAGFAVAAFAGDDRGDLAAFQALADAVAAGRVERALRIGVTSPEMPPELADHVDAIVSGPDGFAALLRLLVARVGDEISEPLGRSTSDGEIA